MSEADVTQSGTAGLCVADTGALLRRACTVHVLEHPASAGRRAADVTDHDWICGYHWLGVQQHSALVEVCLSQTSAPQLVQSYSNRGTSWQRHARVSSQTRRRVNVGLVSVLAKPEKNASHTRCSSDGLLLNFSWFYVQDIPHQMNGSDCGMFACKFAEYVARNARITFSQVSWHRCVVYCSSAAMLDFVL